MSNTRAKPPRLTPSRLKHTAQHLASPVLGFATTTRTKCRAFLRSVGLAFTTLTTGAEEPKVLLKRSRWTALARCGVHIIPSAVSMVVIVVNLCQLYIGVELVGESGQDSLKLGVLQVCAKVQELFIVGSLGTMIFHVLRGNLVGPSGVPLGLLGSGFSFTQISFFWSPDFLGSIGYRDAFWYRKWLLISLLLVSGVLALLAGPATAVLMIPRQADWPIGGMNLWLNGSEDKLWPGELSVSSLGGHECSLGDSWRDDPSCPSAGYRQISTYISTLRRWPGKGLFDINIQDSRLWKAVYAFEAQDQTLMTTPHGMLGGQTVAARGMWTGALWYPTRAATIKPIHRRIKPYAWIASYPREQKFKVKGEIPAVRVACATPEVFYILNPAVPDLPIRYPRLSPLPGEPITWDPLVPKDVMQKLLNRTAMFQNAPMEQIVTYFGDWHDEINGQTMILMSPVYNNGTVENGSWLTVGCAFAAHWGDATTSLTQLSSGQTYDHWNDQGFQRAEVTMPPWPTWGYREFLSPKEWRRINLTSSWFDVAFPVLGPERANDLNGAMNYSNTLDSILTSIFRRQHMGFLENMGILQHAIALTLVDGVSRASVHMTTNYSAMLEPVLSVPAPWSKSLVGDFVFAGKPDSENHFNRPNIGDESPAQVKMEVTLWGYIMACQGWFDYLCVAVLLLHASMALGYTLYTSLISPTTSEAWETIPEMLALAQNSPVPEGQVLANSCAGIWRWRTPRQVAWVEDSDVVGADGEKSDSEQLRLRFREDASEKRDAGNVITVGKAFGARGVSSVAVSNGGVSGGGVSAQPNVPNGQP